MDPNRQKLGLAGLLLLLAAGAAVLILGRTAHSLTALVAAVFACLGLLVTAVSVFQMRLEEQERLEKLELDELARSASPGSNLFASESDSLRARRTREQFEKYVVPGFTVLLLGGEIAAALLLWRLLARPVESPFQNHTVLMAVAGLFALLLFMLGKYAAGIVRIEKHRLLQPAAGFLLLNAYVCLAVAATAAAEWADFRWDPWVGRGLCVVLGLIAAETLVGLVFEAYRPRLKGRQARLLYDSRLVGLLSQPESLVTTLAHALDYQFGFRVSETWFYRFLQKALAWIVLAQAAILLLSTTFVIVEPGEQALLERFGKPVAGRQLLGPGLHFKLPWPIDKTHPFRTDQLQSFLVGIVVDEKAAEKAVLWTVGHAREEYNMLVASHEPAMLTNLDAGKRIPAVNLLAVNIPVQYQVTNLLEWAYNHAEAGKLLERLATREVARYLASADINELMSRGRKPAAEELRQSIQAAAISHRLGARIVFLGLAGIHPPVEVAGAYEKVVATMQQAEAGILAARAHAIETNTVAVAAAYRKEQEALAEKLRRERDSLARAAAFSNQIPAFAAAPAVYATRAYLQSLAQAGAGARKYILAATNTHDVLQLNLEDKLRLDLLRATAPAAEPKAGAAPKTP